MIHLHRRLLLLAGDIRWYVAITAALGLGIVASYVVQGLLLARTSWARCSPGAGWRRSGRC